MNPMRSLAGLLLAAGTALLAVRFSSAADAPSPRLAFTRAGNELQFDTGVLKGTLAEGGKPLGLRPLAHVASGVQLAGAFGILSPYRLLTADARFGTAAWDWASTSDVLPDGAARLHWPADKDHPLEMTGTYRWAAADTLDLELVVKPQRGLRQFETLPGFVFQRLPRVAGLRGSEGRRRQAVSFLRGRQVGRRLADVSPR